MSEKDDILGNYKPDMLYITPTADKKTGYVSIIDFEISKKIKLAIEVFYVKSKNDFSSFQLVKLKLRNGIWTREQEMSLSGFQLQKIRDFLQILNGLEIQTLEKGKLSLVKEIDIASLSAILQTEKGSSILKALAKDINLSEDVFALAYKKAELEKFEKLLINFSEFKESYIIMHQLAQTGEENIWQNFFERNPLIFGHGLNYIFLEKEGQKLESVTTGHTFNSSGKRIDALMHTKAKISQYVLIEIKKPSSELMRNNKYRSGCWAVSDELIAAVTQVQKTVFDFIASNRELRVARKDEIGRRTDEETYKITPKSYLVIGNLAELEEHDDKIICFELFRNSLNSPEIITYDELYHRAKCIVETLSNQQA